MQMNNKEIIMFIKVMNAGGAERVLTILANHLHSTGYKVTLLLTHQKMVQTNLQHLNNDIQVIALEDELTTDSYEFAFHLLLARIVGKLATFVTGNSDKSLVLRYAARNYKKIKWIKKYLCNHSHAHLIAFLYDSIFLTLLSRKTSNRLIISERGDPCQSLSSKTDFAFFRTMFPHADAIVFQSPDVCKWYKDHLGIDGTVIFNPIMTGLPEPFQGKRNKQIVNFCRLSPAKNLYLLINSFEKLHQLYPDYELWIYGDADSAAMEYSEQLKSRIAASNCRSVIHLRPATEEIHTAVLGCAMFVSSSDYEGMSNSMLEAMAIGLPVVCTDCPAGGARAVIKDHENGLLVPVNDPQSLFLAMKELIDNPELATKLSENAIKIRRSQSEKVIMEQWNALLLSLHEQA